MIYLGQKGTVTHYEIGDTQFEIYYGKERMHSFGFVMAIRGHTLYARSSITEQTS